MVNSNNKTKSIIAIAIIIMIVTMFCSFFSLKAVHSRSHHCNMHDNNCPICLIIETVEAVVNNMMGAIILSVIGYLLVKATLSLKNVYSYIFSQETLVSYKVKLTN